MLSAESCLESICQYFPGHGKVMLLSISEKGDWCVHTWPSWSLFSALHTLQGQSRKRQWQIYMQKPLVIHTVSVLSLMDILQSLLSGHVYLSTYIIKPDWLLWKFPCYYILIFTSKNKNLLSLEIIFWNVFLDLKLHLSITSLIY